MPGGNGTGPSGMGSMTGRGAGYCAGYSIPGSANPTFGRGMGLGFRGGRGGRWARPYGGYAYNYSPYVPGYNPAPSREQEMSALQSQVQNLKGALEQIQKRISELEG